MANELPQYVFCHAGQLSFLSTTGHQNTRVTTSFLAIQCWFTRPS